MEYREIDLPAQLRPFVRAVWHLCGMDGPHAILTNNAMPDGCVELIHRMSGTSQWDGEQPTTFVAGLCSKPAHLTMSGDASFLGVRLWPWAWNLLDGAKCPEFHDRWLSLDQSLVASAILAGEDKVVERLLEAFSSHTPDPIGASVPNAKSSGDLTHLSGRNHRAIQRWFAREVGMPPRRYFKLLRFQKAIEATDAVDQPLADQAASLGYADQSHMARDFRSFAQGSTSKVRAGAVGPFIDR
ncbi:helix-turn-helix domain-containing protein [Pontixanthobacter sp. CEM42]|uniref:helix-turn-helix domain-containing protein n=1 Tax=Pontixanthobacter sp. CEM42 TaxID=2792077 RepID=UPI0032AF4F73